MRRKKRNAPRDLGFYERCSGVLRGMTGQQPIDEIVQRLCDGKCLSVPASLQQQWKRKRARQILTRLEHLGKAGWVPKMDMVSFRGADQQMVFQCFAEILEEQAIRSANERYHRLVSRRSSMAQRDQTECADLVDFLKQSAAKFGDGFLDRVDFSGRRFLKGDNGGAEESL
jgi:hypothetical protein